MGDRAAPDGRLTVPQNTLDDANGIRDGHVLPNTHGCPPSAPELLVGVSVSLPVALDLLGPIPTVGLVLPVTVLCTAVPEAAVDEHRHLRSRKDDVRLPTEVRQRAAVHEIAEPSPVELPS